MPDIVKFIINIIVFSNRISIVQQPNILLTHFRFVVHNHALIWLLKT